MQFGAEVSLLAGDHRRDVSVEPMPSVLDLEGLIPATVVPMTDAGAIDEPALRAYLRWVGAQQPNAIALNADTGEAPHLTHAERIRVLEIGREVLDVPIVCGLGGPFTAQAVAHATAMQSAGADALLVFPISAFLGAPLDPAIPVEYHREIAGVGLPLIAFQLQPALGGVVYEPETLRELLRIDGVVALKEASFDRAVCRATAAIVAAAERPVTMLTGNDNFILDSFDLGCRGALIGFGALLVREQVAMIRAALAGDATGARAISDRIQPLADAVFASPVRDYRARVKECLVMQGVLERATVRAPLHPIADADRLHLRHVLRAADALAGVRA
jgi:4-hydroxy-tetrahydrodipicolinate synthase